MRDEQRSERPMSQRDIARLAAALLEAIERGDVEANQGEKAFLRSLADLQAPRPAIS